MTGLNRNGSEIIDKKKKLTNCVANNLRKSTMRQENNGENAIEKERKVNHGRNKALDKQKKNIMK